MKEKSAIEKLIEAGEELKKMAGNHRVDYDKMRKTICAWDEALRLRDEEQAKKPTAPASLVGGLLELGQKERATLTNPAHAWKDEDKVRYGEIRGIYRMEKAIEEYISRYLHTPHTDKPQAEGLVVELNTYLDGIIGPRQDGSTTKTAQAFNKGAETVAIFVKEILAKHEGAK